MKRPEQRGANSLYQSHFYSNYKQCSLNWQVSQSMDGLQCRMFVFPRMTSSRIARYANNPSFQMIRMFSALPEHISVTMPALSPVSPSFSSSHSGRR